MSLYLAYSYSSCLTKKEENKINERVHYSQEQFYQGFNKGVKFSLMAYSIYSLTTTVAYASDQCPSTDTCPSPANPPAPGTDVVKPKPGFKPLPSAAKGAAIGGATGVCGAALQSGDFIYGLLCGLLLVGIGWVNNRE
jgi:hypothetical protein